MPVRFAATLVKIERSGPEVATYHLSYTGRRLRFRPGQFVHLAIDPFDPSRHWPESRVFSIASGRDAETIRLTVSRQGGYTSRILDELKVGDTVWLKGPYGDFVVQAQGRDDHSVLIAGGTGITPFCAFMEEWLRDPGACLNPVHLYYGARTADLLVYRYLADRCASELPRFSVRYYIEHGHCDSAVSGRLDIDQIVTHQEEVRRCVFYLSGPKAMIDVFSAGLRETYGVLSGRVVVDAWD